MTILVVNKLKANLQIRDLGQPYALKFKFEKMSNLSISRKGYIKNLLAKYEITSPKPSFVPMQFKLELKRKSENPGLN